MASNLVSSLVLFIIISNLIHLNSTSPFSARIFLKTISSNSSILSDQLSENKTLNSNFTNQLKDNSTSVAQSSPRTFQLLELNSWLIGWIMRSLQGLLGKIMVPDSMIIFLQTLVNPFYPFTHSTNLFSNIKENNFLMQQSQSASQKTANDDLMIDVLEALKPKIIDGLSELADSGILDKIHPLINLTIEALDEQDTKDPFLNPKAQLIHPIIYDLIDYNKFNETLYSNELHELNHTMIVDLVKKEIKKKVEKQANSTDDKIVKQLSELITNSPLINLTNDESNTTIKQKNPPEKISSSDPDKLAYDSDQYNSKDTKKDQTKVNKDGNKDDIKSKELNKTEYVIDKGNDLEEPIISLISCDGDKCEEEFLDKPFNETNKHTEEPKKDLAKPTGNFTTNLKRLMTTLKTSLIIKPAIWTKDRLVRTGSVIKRDLRLLFKMMQAIIGSISSTCRYKFLCLFSSFFSLHTPDYIKANMPTQVENYYFKIMEAANRHEFLNAIVTGYVGFDCNDFYVDPKCPE